MNILAAKDSTYNRHDVKQTYNYWTIENNRDRDNEDYKLSVVGSNFNVGGGKITAKGDVLVKGSNFKSNGNLEIDANDITVMGAYNYSKSTIKRGNRKRGSIEIEEDWSVAKSSFAVDGNFRYKLNKTDANGGANTLEVIGSDFKVAGDVRGNVEIEKVKQREVHVSIQQNWDSGIIGMTKGPIGDVGQFLYENLSPWGLSDAIKRDYLESPNLLKFGANEDQHTGIDTIDATTSRHKESWIPLRQDSEHDLVNIIKGASGIFSQNDDVMITLNKAPGWESFSRIHDKQAGDQGYDRHIAYKINDVFCIGISGCSAVSSIPLSFTLSTIAGVGNAHIGNITTNPFTGFGLFGGGANKNYNRSSEGTKDSSVSIGGDFYLDDKAISNGVIEQEKIYGSIIISNYQAKIEANKYKQNNTLFKK